MTLLSTLSVSPGYSIDDTTRAMLPPAQRPWAAEPLSRSKGFVMREKVSTDIVPPAAGSPPRKRAVLYVPEAASQEHTDAAGARLEAAASERGYDLVARQIERRSNLLKRPRLKRVFARAAEGKVDVLLVADPDDLAGNRLTVARLVIELADLGVEVVAVDGRVVDPNNQDVRWIAGEQRRHRGRVRRGLAARRRRGERFGNIPYGMRLAADGVRLEPDGRERAAISMAARLCAGGMSNANAAVVLRQEGFMARGGGTLNAKHVQRMLSARRSDDGCS